MLVVSTTSTRALCAGADVAEELDHAGGVARMEAFARVYAALEAFPAPTVASASATSWARAPSSPPAATCASAATTSGSRGRARGSACPVGPARLAPLVGLARQGALLTGRALGMEEARALGLLHRTAPAAGAEAAASRWRASSPPTRRRGCGGSRRCSARSTAPRGTSRARTSGS